MSACSPIIFYARVFSIKIRLHLERFNSGEELKAPRTLCLPETCPSSLKVTMTSFCAWPNHHFHPPLGPSLRRALQLSLTYLPQECTHILGFMPHECRCVCRKMGQADTFQRDDLCSPQKTPAPMDIALLFLFPRGSSGAPLYFSVFIEL